MGKSVSLLFVATIAATSSSLYLEKGAFCSFMDQIQIQNDGLECVPPLECVGGRCVDTDRKRRLRSVWNARLSSDQIAQRELDRRAKRTTAERARADKEFRESRARRAKIKEKEIEARKEAKDHYLKYIEDAYD